MMDGRRPQAHADQCRSRTAAGPNGTPQGSERLDPGSDVINAALTT